MKYVTLLRGVNVGGNARVPMQALTAVYVRCGCMNVRTYINSGNIVCESTKNATALALTLEKAVEDAFGFPIPTLVVPARAFRAIARAIPLAWRNDTAQKADVLFLWKAADTHSVLNALPHTKGVDTVRYVPGAILWHTARAHAAKSKLPKIAGTPLYKQMTVRNINTVRALEKMLS